MPNILVVNDDGIESELLHFLANALLKHGKVIVCAPINEKSAYSHMINIQTYGSSNIIEDKRWNYEAYMINGSPADCVRYGVEFLNVGFDYVFSGANKGHNSGINIFYSGTVSAAVEGTLRQIKACALSAPYTNQQVYFSTLDDVLDDIFTNQMLSMNYTLNINFPEKLIMNDKPSKWVCHEGGKTGYETDNTALKKGYITYTPLLIDKTDYDMLNKLNK